ncbi:6-phosphofructokinase [Guggenheimella bovis]
MKRIGLLTSGGDSPGMNAAIRAVVRTGIYHGFEIIGIERGYDGLLSESFIPLDSRSVSDILFRGGTMLRSARSLEFMEEAGIQKGVEILKKHAIEALIVIGGDGSFRGAKKLSHAGIKTIGIPGTIDNDLGYTDYTIGFDSAITTVMEAVSNIRDTSSSHGRAFVVEVMGRDCGDIALYAGIITGAEKVIVPELPWDYEDIIQSMKDRKKEGKSHYIILLSEGVGNPYEFTQKLEEMSGISTRLAVIGHLQRGGAPSAFDRILATRMGAKAIDLLIEGHTGVAVGIKGSDIISLDIDEAIAVRDHLNLELYELAQILAR